MLDAIEATMDEAGFDTAHIAGNSLGGYLALHLAARGRARSVVALAPAGGWAAGDRAQRNAMRHFLLMDDAARVAAPRAEVIAATPEGRRRASEMSCERFEHLPASLIAHQIIGAAQCTATRPFVTHARAHGWPLPALIPCPARIVWGTADRLLQWPGAAARYREWLATADWVVLPDVGHCIQLDVPAVAAELIGGFTASSGGARV